MKRVIDKMVLAVEDIWKPNVFAEKFHTKGFITRPAKRYETDISLGKL